MTFGSLFAGIGGMDLGLERAGMQCRWQVEIDPYASRVLAKHWPDVPRWDDVRTFPPDSGDWRVDLIAGGFPCQDVSYAGKGAGLAGERSGLWYEFVRILRLLRPQYALIENVAALTVRGMGHVLADLAALGFDAEWSMLSACAMGAPHTRERMFIVSYANRQHVPSRLVVHRQYAGTIQRNCETERAAVWSPTLPDPDAMADGFPARLGRPGKHGLGNAVVPQVAEWIGRRIMEHAARPARAAGEEGK